MVQDQIASRLTRDHSFGVRRSRVAIVAGALLFLLSLCGGAGIYLIWTDQGDLLNSYPSPEFQGQVCKLATFSVLPTPAAAKHTEQDFDGDGVPDKLDLQLFQTQDLGGRGTNGLLVVESGRNGELLYSRTMASFLGFIAWFGDKDGNGTMDLMIVDERRHSIVGYVATH